MDIAQAATQKLLSWVEAVLVSRQQTTPLRMASEPTYAGEDRLDQYKMKLLATGGWGVYG